MHWLTYETNPDLRPRTGSLYKLLRTCKAKKSKEPVILGAGAKWKGFSEKWKAVIRYITENDLADDEIVVITDARDVLLNRAFGTKHFLRSFNEVSQKGKYVVFGCEEACCVEPMYEFPPGSFISKSGRKIRKAVNTRKYWESEESEVYDKNNEKWIIAMDALKNRRARGIRTNGYALNGGLAAGTVKLWLSEIPKLQIQSAKEDDQALWSELFLMPRSKIRLDYKNAVFSNAHTWGFDYGCFFKESGGTFKNTVSRRKPFFIQTPAGHVDSWKCYLKLYKALR